MSAMSAIEQPAARFGQDDRLLGLREKVGGLGHEVHAAEHDRLGIGTVCAAFASWNESPT